MVNSGDDIGKTVGSPLLGGGRAKISCREVNVYYGEKRAIRDVAVDIAEKEVTAFIGPSGCGKSTFLRCINRMNDTIKTCRVEGDITIDKENIYSKDIDPVLLRASPGIVPGRHRSAKGSRPTRRP